MILKFSVSEKSPLSLDLRCKDFLVIGIHAHIPQIVSKHIFWPELAPEDRDSIAKKTGLTLRDLD